MRPLLVVVLVVVAVVGGGGGGGGRSDGGNVAVAICVWVNRVVNEAVCCTVHTWLGIVLLKQDSANRRLGNAASASSISFRIKENAKSRLLAGFSEQVFCG